MVFRNLGCFFQQTANVFKLKLKGNFLIFLSINRFPFLIDYSMIVKLIYFPLMAERWNSIFMNMNVIVGFTVNFQHHKKMI